MFSTLHTSARAVLLTALVGGSALVVPATAGAQSVTPEQALMNRVPAAPSGAPISLTQRRAAGAFVEQAVIDGERALLNRLPAAYDPLTVDPEPGETVIATPDPDGVRALLNRSSL